MRTQTTRLVRMNRIQSNETSAEEIDADRPIGIARRFLIAGEVLVISARRGSCDDRSSVTQRLVA